MKLDPAGLSFELKRESELLWERYDDQWFPSEQSQFMTALLGHFLAGSFVMLLLLEEQNFPLARSGSALNRDS